MTDPVTEAIGALSDALRAMKEYDKHVGGSPNWRYSGTDYLTYRLLREQEDSGYILNGDSANAVMRKLIENGQRLDDPESYDRDDYTSWWMYALVSLSKWGYVKPLCTSCEEQFDSLCYDCEAENDNNYCEDCCPYGHSDEVDDDDE